MTETPAAAAGAAPLGVDSEVGRLRTVLLHRPGPELTRLTPRNNDKLLFDGIPWVGRAQDEHDTFAQALRDRGVEVLYLADLLATALEVEAARTETIAAVLRDPRLGETLHGFVAFVFNTMVLALSINFAAALLL